MVIEKRKDDNPSVWMDDIRDFRMLEKEYLASTSNSKPRVGYLCLRVPVEYIEATGGVPLRIVPRPGYDASGFSPIRTDGCSFCRSVQAFLDLDYYRGLSAVIAGSCCDQMRRLMEILRNELNIPVILFGAPRTWEADREYFHAEMMAAFSKIEEVTGRRPNEAGLGERIQARNELKAAVNRLRDQEKLPTSLLHEIAATPLPPEKIISFLERYKSRPPMDGNIRLLLAGSIPGVWELGTIETDGARVVADVTCLGDRVFGDSVSEKGDPASQLYETYIEGNLCPHRRPVTPLIDYIRELAAKRAVDGIIYRSVKYCHPWSLLAERIKKEFPAPFLNVDDDLTSPAVGSFRTRTGAFIEMLKMRSKRRA